MGDGGGYPSGEVVDLLTVLGRLDVVDALLADATGVFDDNGINVCSTRLLEGHPYERVFRRHGFLKMKRKTHVFYSSSGMEDEIQILETTSAARIHLSWGDLR